MKNTIEHFIGLIQNGLNENNFVELNLTNKRESQSDLRLVLIKKIKLKSGEKLSFVYRHTTKDITKNYVYDEALTITEELLKTHFSQASLITLEQDFHLTIHVSSKDKSEKIKINKKPPTHNTLPSSEHNKKKAHIVDNKRKYLRHLGVTNDKGEILKAKHSKFRQINKFIELVSTAINEAEFKEPISFVDMGSGLGYLTFALYDHLLSKGQNDVYGKGVEMRPSLVEKCNEIAKTCTYEGLSFVGGTIADVEINNENILMALHACDTATDDAIAKGIRHKMKVIICSPCCHKQVRKSMTALPPMKSVTKHGILKERQAEIVTDTIRALVMEAHGYKTKVVEFISSEHTSKNLMIIGVKVRDGIDEKKLAEVQRVMELFGLREHYLVEKV